MKEEKINFQSVKVKFPKKLYLFTSWLVTDEKKLMLYPSNKLYRSQEKALSVATELFWKIRENALNFAFIQTLEYLDSFPLKKEYWDSPSVPFDSHNKMLEFLKIYQNHKEYKLLVTPFDAKKGIFQAASAFLNSATPKDIEAFMYASDWYVDPKGDSCAFYSISEPLNVDLLSGKVVDKERKLFRSKKKFLVN